MSTKRENEEFPPDEAQRRFEAAIRAALNTPPKPMKDMPKKRKPRARDAPSS